MAEMRYYRDPAALVRTMYHDVLELYNRTPATDLIARVRITAVLGQMGYVASVLNHEASEPKESPEALYWMQECARLSAELTLRLGNR